MRPDRALVVAFTLLAAACTPFGNRTPSPQAPVVTEDQFAALWPEQILAEAQRADVDPATWRLDPTSTAQMFASDVLGWTGSRIVNVDTWTLSSGVDIARVWLCRRSGCSNEGASFDEEVMLKRLVSPRGVWSVTDVSSGRILIDEGPFLRIGDPEMKAGRRLTAFTPGGISDGTEVVAGSAYSGACGPVVDAGLARFWFQSIRFQVAASDDVSCGTTAPRMTESGYIFVMRRGNLRRQGVAGQAPRSLFTVPRQEGAPPLLDLTAMAVRFEPRPVMPSPPPAWLSRDPSSLPACADGQIRLGQVSAGESAPNFGVGIALQIAKRHVPACHASLDVRLTIADGRGRVLGIPGKHRLHVDGYLPGYHTGPRVLIAAWALAGWCGRAVPGPILLRFEVAGQELIAPSLQLSHWCPSTKDPPGLRRGPGSD